MAENDLIDTVNVLGVKNAPLELNASAPDFIPLQKSTISKIQDKILVPNETNGNNLEKNGQKRIQTAPIDTIDGISKKPRINTTEHSNVTSQKAGVDEQDLNKKADGEENTLTETYLNKNVSGNHTDLNKKVSESMCDVTEINKKVDGEETDLSKKAVVDKIDLNKKATSDETDLIKNAESVETDLSNKVGSVETDFSKIVVEGGVEEMDQSSDEEYYLTVHNLPSDWTYVQIKNYLDQECGHVDEMEMLKHRKSKNCAIRLTFQNLEKCTEVFKKLENKFVQDKKLKVKICDTYTTFPTGVTVQDCFEDFTIKPYTISNEVISVTRWRPDLDYLDTDPAGLYGLRREFLTALGITPPLNKIVHVTNFRCDKNELREVMELAGHVLMCCVVTSIAKYGKVMYSHPLEAVQAISMLNGQLYYGVPLQIAMEKNHAESVVLPKGLASIGQGLGIKARPIRNIAQQYHRYAKKQSSSINPIIFSEIDFSDEVNRIKMDENPEAIEKKIKEFMISRPGVNMINPTVQVKPEKIDEMECPFIKEATNIFTPLPPIISRPKRGGKNKSGGSPQDQTKNGLDKQQNNQPAGASNPLFRLGNPNGPGIIPPMLNPPGPRHNPMRMPGPREPFFRPGNPQEPRPFGPGVPFMPPRMCPPFQQPRPPFGPPTGMRPQMPPNFNGPRANIGNSVTVKFSNLPPSTTFPLLCDLIAQCGQVMSVQLTTPGCAVATFGHPSHAERCYQSFNGRNVEGFIIEIGFM